MAEGSTGCAARLALFVILAMGSLGCGAAIGAGLAHTDQDLVVAEWLSAQGVPLPASLYP